VSLYPGNVRKVASEFILDDIALEESMAKVMEDEFSSIFQKIKGEDPPGKDDMRLIFVAISRGILGYLKSHQNEIFSSINLKETQAAGGQPIDVIHKVNEVDLNVMMNK